MNLTISKKPLYNKNKKSANALVKALSVLDNLQEFNGSLKELAERIEQGYVIIPALLEKRIINDNGIYTRSMANFKQIEMLAIDIDNTEHFTDPITKEQVKIDYYIDDTNHVSIEEAKNILTELGLDYAMIYTTLSHSEKQHKFRILFNLKAPIENVHEAKKVYLNLGYTLEKLGLDVDGRALEPSRLFFPGKIIELKEDSYLDISKLKEYIKPNNKVKKNKNINEIIQSDTILVTRQSDICKSNCVNKLSITKLINYINEKIKYPLEVDYTDRYLTLNKLINLFELLNVEEDIKFQCILPDHLDNDASSYVYKTNEDITVYHCFGCDNRLNPIQFIKFYFNIDEIKLFNILEKNTPIKIGSVYQKMVQDISFKSIMYISDKKGLQFDNELVYKYLSRRRLLPLLESLYILSGLNATKMPILDREDNLTGASFFISNSSLQKYYNSKYNTKLTEDNIRNKINVLTNLGFIEKVSLSEVRQDIKSGCINYLKKMNLYKYPNFYLLKPITMECLKQAEYIISLEQTSCVKARNQGKKQTTVIQGEKANQIYVQNYNSINIEEETLYKQLIKAISNLNKEYFTFDEIFKLVDKKRRYKKAYKQKQLEIYISKLILDKKINRVKGSKAIKTKYSIQAENINQYTYVYVLLKVIN